MIKTIGCCDSGLGGMLVANALRKQYPSADIVFIADQSNVPYGDKTVKQLDFYARSLLNKFREMKVHDVVIACNTLCANVIDDLRDDYQDLHIYSIIEPTCQQLTKSKASKVAVLATAKTVETHAYKKQLKMILPDAQIVEIQAPKLVPIIENGCNEAELKQAVKEYLVEDADAYILGCTHFPLIRKYIENNRQAEIYDSNEAIVNLFKDEEFAGHGDFKVYTSGNASLMQQRILNLLGEKIEVNEIQL